MERINELYKKNKSGEPLTKADKDYIRKRAEDFGLEVTPTRCKSFWLDTMILIQNAYSKSVIAAEKGLDPADIKCDVPQLRPAFRRGIRWNLRKIDQDMMTVELYNEMVASGLGGLFEK